MRMVCEWDKEIHNLGLPLLGDGAPVQWKISKSDIWVRGRGRAREEEVA